jgi:hypothetical protein
MHRLVRPPYRDFHPRFLNALERFSALPAPEHYDELAALVPRAHDVELPRFVTERRDAVRRAGGYESHVAKLRAVPTRPGHWHDFFNMCVWAHFPKLRWALNALHVAAPGEKDPRNGRTPAQNLAATFDEAGLLVLSSSRELIEELRELHFKHVFWHRRAELLATTQFWLVGHGMLESLLEPHPGLTARSLLLDLSALKVSGASTTEPRDALRFAVDAVAAAHIESWHARRAVLDPIPVLAIPGYCDNDAADFYEDRHNIPFDQCSRRHARGVTD